MTTKNFNKKLDLVLAHEGGYVDHPKDPGGATNLGVTIGTLSAWLGRPATKAEVKALTKTKVAPIYKKQYWDKIQGDELPEGLDYAVFDYAVNSGPGRAAKDLQKIVGVAADGAIGLHTLQAIKGWDTAELINKLMDRRLAFLKSLKTWKTFGKGWSSRVAGVRSAALQMNQNANKKIVASLVDLRGAAKANPEDQSVFKTSGGQATSLASLGAIGATATEGAQQLVGLTEYLEVAKWIFILLTVVGVAIGGYVAWKKAKSADDAE